METLANPWVNGDPVAAAEARVWASCQEMAPAIGAAIGGHDERWWRWVLMPWLVHAVSVAEDGRAFLEQATAHSPGAPVVLFEPAADPPPTMGVGVARLRSSRLHRAMLGQIATQMGLPLVAAQPSDRDRLAPEAQEAAWAAGRQDPMVLRLRRRAAALMLETGRSTVAVLGQSGLSGRQALALRRRTGARILPARVAVPAAPPASAELRKRLERCADSNSPLTRAVAALLPLVLPRSVAEGAQHLASFARRTYGYPSNVLVGNYGADETMNAHIAGCAAAGKRVDHAQHGGFYLQAEVNAQERLEVHEGSAFLSWQEVPNPRLERIRNTHTGGAGVVLVEGLNPPDPFVIRFASTPLADQAYESAEMLGAFAAAVDDAVPLALRRFPRAGAIRPATLERLPQAAGAGAVEAMRTARLAVLAYPDTPFVEAMVLGVPTIGLWNRHHWRLRADARPAFEALSTAGLVFDDPEAAARQVNEVYAKAEGWWESQEVAAARSTFIARFAPAGDWLAAWTAHLRGMRG